MCCRVLGILRFSMLYLSTKLVHVMHNDPPALVTDSSPSPLKWPHPITPHQPSVVEGQWLSGDVEQ